MAVKKKVKKKAKKKKVVEKRKSKVKKKVTKKPNTEVMLGRPGKFIPIIPAKMGRPTDYRPQLCQEIVGVFQ